MSKSITVKHGKTNVIREKIKKMLYLYIDIQKCNLLLMSEHERMVSGFIENAHR